MLPPSTNAFKLFVKNLLLEADPDSGVVASLLVKNAPASTSHNFKVTPGLKANDRFPKTVVPIVTSPLTI